MSKKTRVAKPVAAKDAVYVYLSACCNAPATKPACEVPQGGKIGTYIGAIPDPDERNTSLGSWRCSTCRKPAKVSRVKPEPKSEAKG